MNAQLESGQPHALPQPISQSAGTLAPPEARSHAPMRDWQESVQAEYAGTMDASAAHLRRTLARRVLTLAGRTVPDQAIVVDGAAQWAMAVVDGIMFQLRAYGLTIVRPCAYCGTGHFASLPLVGRIDLGHALAGWQPLHAECAPTDPSDDVGW